MKIRPTLSYTPQITELLGGIDPVVHQVVDKFLQSTDQQVVFMLGAWDRCGRRDARNGRRPYITTTMQRTLSPYGLACCIRYAQAFEDERQAMAAELPT